MRWGLSLGGGSLRGAAHIGVLKVLDSEGLRPVAIAGTSAGAIVGALYAAGLTGQEIENLVLTLNKRTVFDKALKPCQYPAVLGKVLLDLLGFNPSWKLPLGLFLGDNLAKEVALYTQNYRLSDLSMKTAINAVDLDTGEEIIFTNAKMKNEDNTIYVDGFLWEAVRASISLPGIFTPYKWQNRRLVDGGVSALNPAKILRRMGLPFVIAIDVSLEATDSPAPDNFVEVLLRSFDLLGYRKNKEELRLYADLTVEAGYKGVGLKEFTKIEECIAFGEKAMRDALKKTGISILRQ